MDIGAKLRKLRKSKNLTEQELADLTNISQPVINRLENNAKIHDVESINRICSALGMSLSEFFAEEELVLPPEIRELVSKEENHGPLKIIQAMIKKGYSPEAIEEGVSFLDNALESIKQKYDVPEAMGKTVWINEELLPEGAKGKFTEEEKQALLEKGKKKQIDPNFKHPWDK